MNNKLTYPHVRNDIESDVLVLANYIEQKKYWLDSDNNEAYLKDFLSDFFDYYDFENCAYSRIGQSLYDEQEAQLSIELSELLLDIWHKDLGVNNYNFQDYLDNPKWPRVVAKAKELYNLMKENDIKYGFKENLDRYYRGEIKQ